MGTPVVPPRPDDKGAAYLDALTSAGVPRSASGATEIQIAQGVCTQLAQGKSRQKLVEDIAAVGGLMTDDQADALVTAAEQHYC
ncbi:DUF732 domain-containing protein [Umezawaea sp. Da 62-37]|uniref:DUF732 domain-containing protein n=1 Tax=Umezawaea sp. Da 62-37 TaxID=3075927 RepID=UPI0028F6FC3F|nr:DUF732 domain-containing protein [Umezawaea sp. Da 62-37]WNV84471.1 DUF732 domain-containing protein [Umezawaea sp. Da 62-37]